MVLRMCERYGIDPRGIDDIDPGLMAMLMEQERIRQHEESGVPR